MLVKPAPDRKVRDPATRQFVPDDGLEVSPLDLYWSRAIRDGDVVEVDPQTTAAPEAEEGSLQGAPLDGGGGDAVQLPPVEGDASPPIIPVAELGASAEAAPDASIDAASAPSAGDSKKGRS